MLLSPGGENQFPSADPASVWWHIVQTTENQKFGSFFKFRLNQMYFSPNIRGLFILAAAAM